MKRALILGVLCTLINFSSITEANSIKYLAETTSTETSGSTGAAGESGGSQSGSAGSGTTGGSSNPNSNGNVNKVESANPEVRLDGAIGPWAPNDGDMPNFDNIKEGDLIGTKPDNDKLFKISVTVPLNMNFMIVSDDPIRFTGKFICPYYYITNNGTYPLDVSFESFTRADESSNSSGTARTNSSSKDTKLYVEEPQAGNNKVEMRLSLNYDRPQQGTYLKTIDLHTLNKNRTSEKNKLGEIGSNETARIYYRSDLWETPFSEGITTDVASNFNLILSFSTQNTNSGTGGTESGDVSNEGADSGTGSEGNASSTPSSGNITSGGSTGSNANAEPSGN